MPRRLILPRVHVLDGVEEVRGELLEVLRALLKDVEEPRADAALRLGEELGRVRAVHRVGRQEGVPRAEVHLVLLPHRVARGVEPGQARDGHNTADIRGFRLDCTVSRQNSTPETEMFLLMCHSHNKSDPEGRVIQCQV